MSIFEYDKEEEEQKLQATYEKQGELKKAKSIAISLAQEGESIERIARILGETEKQLKNGWLKRIKIGSAVSSTECYCGTFLYPPAILAGEVGFYLRIPDSSSSIHLSVLKLLSKNLTITP